MDKTPKLGFFWCESHLKLKHLMSLRIPYVLKTNDLSEMCKAKAIENKIKILQYQNSYNLPIDLYALFDFQIRNTSSWILVFKSWNYNSFKFQIITIS